MITQSQVNELFDYKDGHLVWKKPLSNRAAVGERIKRSKNNLFRVGIYGKNYLAHRIIFLMHHGYIPHMIDHVDGNPLNNRIENLRECNKKTNGYNAKISKRNSTGVKSVFWNESNKNWRVRMRANGADIEIGSFDQIIDAKIAADNARVLLHNEFARNE